MGARIAPAISMLLPGLWKEQVREEPDTVPINDITRAVKEDAPMLSSVVAKSAAGNVASVARYRVVMTRGSSNGS
jgi:hypothetical protein